MTVTDGSGGSGVGSASPDFSIDTISGATFRSPTGKPTVLYFLAGWCSSCVPEAQALDQIERATGDRVAILAVSADPTDSASTLQQFAQFVGSPRYGFALDDGTLVRRLGVRALDTTIVLDPAGRIVYRDAIPTEESTLRAALARAGLR